MTEKKSYFAVIPASVRYCKKLKANAKLLYGELTALSNESGYCWASNNYFAELYEVDECTISRWIKQLEKYNFIRIEYKRNGYKIEERKIFILEPLTKKSTADCSKDQPPIDQKVKENNTYNNTTNNTYYKNEFFTITEKENLDYLKTFDYVDLLNEYNKMRLWLIANPKKQKSNYKRFILNWLNRVEKPKEQNLPDYMRS